MSDVGIYSFFFSLAQLPTIIQQGFNTAYTPIFYSEYENHKKIKSIQTLFIELYAFVLMVFIIFIFIFFKYIYLFVCFANKQMRPGFLKMKESSELIFLKNNDIIIIENKDINYKGVLIYDNLKW